MGEGERSEERQPVSMAVPFPCIPLVIVDRVLEVFRNVIALGVSGDPTPPLPVSFLIIGITGWPCRHFGWITVSQVVKAEVTKVAQGVNGSFP